jgi:hypothetical protein
MAGGACFWEALKMAGDGYDRAEVAHKVGWRPVASWGRDGYDLGSWPLVMVFHREHGGTFEVCENVEGDASVYSYSTAAERDAKTDELALFHWRHESEAWVEGVRSVEDMPAELRGPFSWARLKATQELGAREGASG